MAKTTAIPTGREVYFDEHEIIVSKTDPSGRITYANDVFLSISGYTEAETLGQPHSFIRHPDMPRVVYRLLWDAIQAKREIFAYVKNMFHSNRRRPNPAAVAAATELYRSWKAIEDNPANRKDGLAASLDHVTDMLKRKGISYDEFVLSL